ncbi:MAG: hypothetical protein ACR2LM_02030 [Pyrinomonadaceae bacterium]
MCKKTKEKKNASPGPGGANGTPPTPPSPIITIRDSKTATGIFKNPLNDPALAITLLQVNSPSIATPAQFNEERSYRIFVPKQLATDFFNAPAGSKPKARVSVFFGVGPEMTLFRLREFFANETNSVFITVSGVESEVSGVPSDWDGIKTAFGYGISTQIIKDLMALADLAGIDFSVEVMAGFSTGYRGLNLTIINELVNLSKLSRVIYLDAWYHHDDHPLAASPSPFRRKNTLWAIETALAKSPTAKVVIYAFTHPGGVPRSNPSQTNINLPNPPREPVAPLITKFPANIAFIDFEFKFQTRTAIGVELEKICLARLIQLGIGSKFPAADLAAPLMVLVSALPARGSFGTLGLAGFTDLYAWITAHSAEISGFGITQAMTMVTTHQLLSDWTDSSHYEMRHRMFVLELGKEPLVP